MADHPFENLLQTLCCALSEAQASLQRRHERLCAAHLCGDDGPVCLSVKVLRGEEWETLQVPLSDLVGDRRLGIVELAVDLRCEVDLVDAEGDDDANSPRVALRVGDACAPHLLRLVLRGPGPPTGEAFLDGIALGAFGPEGGLP